MTTHHSVAIGKIGLFWEHPDPMGRVTPEDDRRWLRATVAAVNRANAVAWVYDGDEYIEEPVAALIPPGLARELIAEGRLGRPAVASQTVVR